MPHHSFVLLGCCFVAGMLSMGISRTNMSAAQPCMCLCASDMKITEKVASVEWGDFVGLWLSRMGDFRRCCEEWKLAMTQAELSFSYWLTISFLHFLSLTKTEGMTKIVPSQPLPRFPAREPLLSQGAAVPSQVAALSQNCEKREEGLTLSSSGQ